MTWITRVVGAERWYRLRESAEWQLLFRAVWQSDRRLTAEWWALIALRAALPPALSVATG